MEYSDQFIDDYLLGRLQGEALQRFELSIKNDESLAIAIKNRQAILGIVDAIGDIEMMDHIKRIHQKEMTKKSKPKIFRLWRIASVAAVFLVIALGLWLWMRPPVPEKLFIANYEPYPLSFTSRDNNTDSQLAQANIFYKASDYQKALPLFEELYAKDPSQSKFALAIGICKMETDANEEAFQYFQLLGNREFDLFKDHGLWYAALVKLRQGDINTTKEYLKKLVDKPDAYFHKQAVELIEKL